MTQYRVYYAIQQFALARDSVSPLSKANTTAIHGLQSVGITTTFNLEQVFELGQLAIYENIEGIPDVEVSCEKVLDGYPPVYLLATRGTVGDPTVKTDIAARQNAKCTGILSLYEDKEKAAESTVAAQAECVMSGLFVSSISYTFPVDGNQTESCTLVGNDKVWSQGAPNVLQIDVGEFDGNDDVPAATVGVARREDVIMTPADATEIKDVPQAGVDTEDVADWYDACIFPLDINGIKQTDPKGQNEKAGDGSFGAHIQSMSVSTDLGRENLFELGRKGTYYRYVTFPVEVTTEFSTFATSIVQGDGVDALEEVDNLEHQRIRIVSAEGTHIDCGDKNKLASVSWSGGDAGGDNVEIAYTYTNFNDLAVNHTHVAVAIGIGLATNDGAARP